MLLVGPAIAQLPPDRQRPLVPAIVTGETPPAPSPELTLRVYNYARVSPASLALSEKVSDAIFENIGIATVWIDCPVAKTPSQPYPACQPHMGTTDLVLRILPRRMAAKLHNTDESLGSAQTCSEAEPACELTVFYHRVDELAANGYRADRILGYVIAHEVAHVLIGAGHSQEGIMRGEWAPFDLQRISWGMRLDFTANQSARLRTAVVRRNSPPVLDGPTRADLIHR